MALTLYNTLLRAKELFVPLHAGRVGLYVCGPTVYGTAHIGNFRPVVVFDVLARWLRASDFDVTYVRNITDIDDKIMHAAHTQGITIQELTTQTTALFHKNMEALKSAYPTHEPRATAYVDHMITMIETLIAKGFAYAAEGHVLFHVKSHTGYGTLSGAKQDDMLAGARIDVAPYKKDPFDFVLWKPSDITQDVPGWESPWGFGRPGWHIECSAMAAALLDVPFDIHGGGQDLLFPHHENEIAQSCAAHGTSHLARYWMHNGILMVESQKMSKSLGNIITVDDLLQRIPGEVIRFMIIGTHYRATLDWTDVGVVGAKQSLDRLYNALQQAGDLGGEGSIDERFQHALNDDLNTPLAISVLHDIASAIFKENDTDARKILGQTLKTSAAVLGILNDTPQSWFQGDGDAQIAKLIEVRGQARVAKNFAESDRVRDLLLAQGIVLEDTPKGTTWRRL